jgi:anaerobic ribonucleoside-triphosphate reductase
MNIKEIIQHELNTHKEVAFEGYCHDCNTKVQVLCTQDTVIGGAVYKPRKRTFLKCDACFEKDRTLRNFEECEVYSRVVGYLRPVNQWNKGKKAEWKERKEFKGFEK